ncbi:MAG: UDP-N-acetylmuramoyl-tripeptide--D-alanyl-D-alanine ligase [Lachnoclostridium sp.]|nr:UDP-N-acetylmuramoyl-tripeptide--D-alanyl-D-alanine ligase [Lachnoclostridium sp.]
MTYIFAAAILIFALINVWVEFRRDVMMMQQNSYRIDRYRRWLTVSGDTTSYMRLIAGAVVLASFTITGTTTIALTIIGFDAIVNSVNLARRKYKKPLVVTPRVRRILAMMCLLAVVTLVAAGLLSTPEYRPLTVTAVALAIYAFSHVYTIAAVWLLQPVENHINAGYYHDAEKILRSMTDLKVIGITGSYGKTSTKHYLYRILQEQFDVVMTPGSFNTTLGVIRTIREYMKPYNQIFICEMGAKQPGDIKEICDLVHPQIGIITAVGEQHLESFKTIENVQHTKFELVDSLPANGLAVVNDDFEYVANRKVNNVETIRYACDNTRCASYIAKDITYSAEGTEFTLSCPGSDDIRFRTHLVGACNVSNLMACIIVALRLGMDVEKIKYAVEHIEQVEHRLNMKRTPGGVTIIDDAFNSNPTGSAMALDVLASMKGGRRIVLTPGMIELGDRQAELNKRFGEKIATSADIAIIVGEYNRDAIVEGIEAVEKSDIKAHIVDSFDEARQLLSTILQNGDTVLYENDLPDTFK